VILRALRTLYDAKKGDVHKFGSITRGDALLFESESESLAIYDGCVTQPVAVKQQLSKPRRLESERKIIQMLEQKWGDLRLLDAIEDGESSFMAMQPCMCSLVDLIDIKAKRTDSDSKNKASPLVILPNLCTSPFSASYRVRRARRITGSSFSVRYSRIFGISKYDRALKSSIVEKL
jgi:hypothetical protein